MSAILARYKTALLFAVIGVVMLAFFPPFLASYLGALGVYAGYVATVIVLFFTWFIWNWMDKKFKKELN